MKKKKTLLLLIIFLALILVAFGGVYAYITFDIFRTPKQLFGKYLDNQIEQVKTINMGALRTVSDNLKNGASETEYDMKLESESEDVTQLKLGIKTDPVNTATMLTLKVNNNDDELANYSLYADKEKIGLKIPELNKKYFSVEINTLLEEAQKYIEENNLTEKNIELSTENIEKYKNEFKTLYSKYLEDIKSNFTEERFSAEKNVQVDVNGVSVSANKYSFSITSTEIKKIATDLLNKISEEPILSDFMTDEQISNFKSTISTMADENELLEDEKNLKVCVYEKSGNTVKVEIQVNDEVIGEFMLVKTSDTETNVIINLLDKKSEDGEVGKKQTILYVINAENENTTTVTTTSSITYEKEDIEALKKYYEENNYYYYTDEMVEENYKDTSTSQKVTTTLNGETATSKISSESLEDFGYKISKMQINYKFGTQVTFDNLEDSIKIEDYKDDEEKANELTLECMQNLQNNPNTLLGMLFASKLDGDSAYTTIDDNDVTDYTTNNSEKEEIEKLVTEAIDDCLDSYKRDLEENENTNIADYLTVNKISEMMLSSLVSDIELIDGSTLKCKYMNETYYISLVLNAETLKVDKATAYTESEYQSM